MSLKALDELCGWIGSLYTPNSAELKARGESIAYAIVVELAERYMELPVDADGVPIHVGDTLECHANGYDGVFDAFAVGDDCVIGNHPECEIFNNPFKGIHIARYCHHVKPRTITDVLREFAKRVLNSGHQWGLDAEETTAEYADKIRELGVPVVRCRDCKHYTEDEMEYYRYCGSWCGQVEPDGFCAWGERRSE